LGAHPVAVGSKVSLQFKLMLADGRIVESAGRDDPLQFDIGDQTLVEGLEQRLLGLSPGEGARFNIPAQEFVFGIHDDEKVLTMARNEFADEMKLEQGHIVGFNLPNGEEVLGTIRALHDDEVEVDFNHPLVGRDFIFEVEIIDVQLGSGTSFL
jgi:FKBP-type peptidyl-prolyl cis-trans isomerase SlpA